MTLTRTSCPRSCWTQGGGRACRGRRCRWIAELCKRINRIHVKDYSAKPTAPAATDATRPKLLDGDTKRPAVMKALDAAGYSGWAISQQPPNHAADVETARDLALRMGRTFAL